jgi:hypothetical protein
MCMSCVTNADAALTGGILGAASLRVGIRRLLPNPPRWARRVSDAEAQAFVASLSPASAPEAPADAVPVPAAGDRVPAPA